MFTSNRCAGSIGFFVLGSIGRFKLLYSASCTRSHRSNFSLYRFFSLYREKPSVIEQETRGRPCGCHRPWVYVLPSLWTQPCCVPNVRRSKDELGPTVHGFSLVLSWFEGSRIQPIMKYQAGWSGWILKTNAVARQSTVILTSSSSEGNMIAGDSACSRACRI